MAETRKDITEDHLSRNRDGARGRVGWDPSTLWISCSLLGLPLSPGLCLLFIAAALIHTS